MTQLAILYVIGDLDVGGAERHLVQILPALRARGFVPMVYTISHKGKLAPILEESGIEVMEPAFSSFIRKLPSLFRRPLLLISSFASALVVLWRTKAVIAHFFLPQAYVLGGVASFGKPRLIRVMSRRSMNRYQSQHSILARVERLLHPRMNAILGNSCRVVGELRAEKIRDEKLGLLYNGIDLSVFRTLPPRDLTRSHLGIDDATVLIICVANLIPYKGHVDLIRALGLMRNASPISKWVIALVGRDNGIGPSLKQLAEELEIAERILWLGERSDAIALYAASDIGILCSHEEGFSNSVLEGMAAGVPMIVTDVGGNAEAVQEGQCGFVIPPHSPEKLAAALAVLFSDRELRATMGQQARDRAWKVFALETCVSRYAALYESLSRGTCSNVQTVIDESDMADVRPDRSR